MRKERKTGRAASGCAALLARSWWGLSGCCPGPALAWELSAKIAALVCTRARLPAGGEQCWLVHDQPGHRDTRQGDRSEQGEEGRQSCLQSRAGLVRALQRWQRSRAAAQPGEGIWHLVCFSFFVFLWWAVLPSWFWFPAPCRCLALGCPCRGNAFQGIYALGFLLLAGRICWLEVAWEQLWVWLLPSVTVTVNRACGSTGRQVYSANEATYSYAARPGLGWWLFLDSCLPRMVRGPAVTPLGIMQPSQAGDGHAEAKQKTQKMPLLSPQAAAPHQTPGPQHAIQGGTCVWAGCARPSFPTFSLGKSSPGPTQSLLRGKKPVVNWGVLLPCRQRWWLTSGLGKSRTAQGITGKGSGWENTTLGCLKCKTSIPAMLWEGLPKGV